MENIQVSLYKGENTKKIDYFSFKELPLQHHKGIKRILILTESEFVPPLSVRVNTTQNELHTKILNNKANSSIEFYFSELLKQYFILAIINNEIVGFLSYIKGHTISEIDIPNENVYVTTICIEPKYRRYGIANSFYQILETAVRVPFIFTRTWNQNDSHINLLKKRKYELIYEILDDRGTNINTVYYAKAQEL